MKPMFSLALKNPFLKEKLKKSFFSKSDSASKSDMGDEARDANEGIDDDSIGEDKNIIYLTKEGNEYFFKKEYEKAIETYMQALRKISSPVGNKPDSIVKNSQYFSIQPCYHSVGSRLFLNIGAVHLKRKEFDLSMKAFNTSLELALQVKKSVDDLFCFPDSISADAHQNIALVHLKKKNLSLALENFEKAANIRVSVLESIKEENFIISEEKMENGFTILYCLYSYIGMVNERKGNYKESVIAYHRALRSLQRVHSQSILEEAKMFLKLGRVHSDIGFNYDEAMKCYEYALQVKTDLLGKKHIDIAMTLPSIAEIHYLKHEFHQAIKKSKDAIEIASQLEADEGPLVIAEALDIIGKSNESLGNLGEAMSTNKKALKIKLSAVGFEHPLIANSLCNIGNIYCEQEKYEEAITMYKEALRLNSSPELESRRPYMLNCLGSAYFFKENNQEALAYYDQALNLSKQTFRQPLVGKIQNNIGKVFKELGKRDEALQYFRDALTTFRLTGLEVDNPDVTESIRQIAYYNVDEHIKSI